MRNIFGSKMLAAEIKRLRDRGKDDSTIALRLNVPVSKILEIEKRHACQKT